MSPKIPFSSSERKKILLLNNRNEAERLKMWAPQRAGTHAVVQM